MRNIDADYYGYMDDDDGLLIPIEEKCEKEAIRQKIEQWKANEANIARDDEVYDLPEMNVSPSNEIISSPLIIHFSPMMKITLLVDRRKVKSMLHPKIMSLSHMFLFPVKKM